MENALSILSIGLLWIALILVGVSLVYLLVCFVHFSKTMKAVTPQLKAIQGKLQGAQEKSTAVVKKTQGLIQSIKDFNASAILLATIYRQADEWLKKRSAKKEARRQIHVDRKKKKASVLLEN